MTVEVIVPWRAGCPHRLAAIEWLWTRWRLFHPRWALTLATAPAGEWCKAEAVMPAISASTASTIIVADADVWAEGVEEAVQAVEAGGWWAVPHLYVHRLTEEGTAALYNGVPFTDAGQIGRGEPPYVGVPGGGMVVVRRELALDVPLDRRFVGWGGEDHAWGYALESFAGEPWRSDRPLWHLWHPPQERRSRKVGSVASERLRRRYRDARSFQADMRAIVEEARHEWEPRRINGSAR